MYSCYCELYTTGWQVWHDLSTGTRLLTCNFADLVLCYSGSFICAARKLSDSCTLYYCPKISEVQKLVSYHIFEKQTAKNKNLTLKNLFNSQKITLQILKNWFVSVFIKCNYRQINYLTASDTSWIRFYNNIFSTFTPDSIMFFKK